MRTVVYRGENPEFTWIDVTGPDRAELLELAQAYGLHETSVEDCLDPEHLPKFERFGDTTFLILRVFDPAAPEQAGSVQALTRKIAIFARHNLVLTVHRVDLPVMASLRQRFGGSGPDSECSLATLVTSLVDAAMGTYERPLQHAEDASDEFEAGLFQSRIPPPPLQRIHLLKRRVSLFKRLLWQTLAVVQRLVPVGERVIPLYQDLRETAESYHFWAEQILDQVNNLLAMQVALASHRTGEVMRVLTVFAAFFLPLTFIVGVYGMNFDYMPELRWRWGYPALVVGMAGVCLAIYLWFRRRGWLRRPRS